MLDEWGKPLTEGPRILLAQIDLVLGAAYPEPECLVRMTAVKIIFQRDRNPRCHPDLHDCDGLCLHRTDDMARSDSRNAAGGALDLPTSPDVHVAGRAFASWGQFPGRASGSVAWTHVLHPGRAAQPWSQPSQRVTAQPADIPERS
jgi:hypothetical protein